MYIEEKIKKLGYTLPNAPKKGGVYSPCKQFGDKLVYVSGCGPAIGAVNYVGRLGKDVSFDDGCKAAENCILNLLATIKNHLGDLDNIKSFVKALAFVSSDNDFFDHPQVANAATDLLVKIFGEEVGCPSRSAIGVNVLPGNIAVEIEMLIEIK